MPRLNKAQKEARDERKTAVAAQLAADAQTTIGASLGPSDSAPTPPPPPSASALSTNQPLSATAATGASSLSDSTNGINLVSSGTNSASHQRDRSASLQSDTGATRASSIAKAAPSSHQPLPATAIASGSKSPLPPASEMSTSEGSEGEEDGKDKSVALDGGLEEGENDDDEEAGAASTNGSSPEVRCMWEDCGQVFTSLAPFINHLHDDHVGIHKARYACEWTGCPRKGKMQTSRFALLSHLRSHTGEKPFTCPKPECDKSFTRSDALAKHMRVQHNINPVSNRGRRGAGGGEGVNNSGGRASRARGLDDDDDVMADDSMDAVVDELLELAEGENNPSLADIEQALAFQGPTSFAFTYDNLFGPGAKALASSSGAAALSDADLGIQQDNVHSVGPLLGDTEPDAETQRREQEEMAKVLERGRREWIEVTKERARMRLAEEEHSSLKGGPGGADYDSDDGIIDDDNNSTGVEGIAGKKRRRSQGALNSDSLISNQGSTTRGSVRNAEQAMDGAKLRKVYLIEKAKLRMIQQENERMRKLLVDLRLVELEERIEKRKMLEKALEAELGRDVAAIFSPPPSPTLAGQ